MVQISSFHVPKTQNNDYSGIYLLKLKHILCINFLLVLKVMQIDEKQDLN